MGLSDYESTQEKEKFDAFYDELIGLLQKLPMDFDQDEVVRVIRNTLKSFNNAHFDYTVYSIFGRTMDTVSVAIDTLVGCAKFLIEGADKGAFGFIYDVDTIRYEATNAIMKEVSMANVKLWNYCLSKSYRFKTVEILTRDYLQKFSEMKAKYTERLLNVKNTKEGE